MKIKATINNMVFAALLWLAAGVVEAQEGKVMVMNASDAASGQTIRIKWYTQEVWYRAGVNIYRKEIKQNEWQKLNASPITKATCKKRREEEYSITEEAYQRYLAGDTLSVMQPYCGMSPKEYVQDSSLLYHADIVNETPHGALEGMSLMLVMLKSIESQPFARFLGITYEDTQVEKGKTYHYKVAKIDRRKEVLLGISPPITAGAYQPSAPPTAMAITSARKKVHITWQPEPDRYYAVHIYRRTGLHGPNERITATPIMIAESENQKGEMVYPEVFFTDDSLQENTSYAYQLAGIDFFGRETQRSELIPVFMKDRQPPPPPEQVKKEINNRRMTVALSWEASPANDLQGYAVYRSRAREGDYEKVNETLLPPAAVSYTDQVPQCGGYYYKIAAVDAAGHEAPSEKIWAEVHDAIPPAAPTGLVVRPDTGKVVLSWQPNTEPDLNGYLIYRAIDEKENFMLLSADPVAANQYTEKLPRNTRSILFYNIVALDTLYNKSEPSSIAMAQLPDVTPPPAPFIKKIHAAAGGIAIEWLPSLANDLAAYHVYRSSAQEVSSSTSPSPITLPAHTTAYTDRTVRPNTSYAYYIQAVDSSGHLSAPSNTRSEKYTEKAVVPLPTAPKNLQLHYAKADKQVEVTWELSPDYLGCVIYRKTPHAGFSPLTGLLKTTAYTDRAIAEAGHYAYQVRAYTQSGDIVRSEVVTVMTR